MIRWTVRLLALLLALYGIGFAIFALTLPKAAGDEQTDAIVVLTGSPGRLERGFALLEAGRAQAVLISGVPPDARPQDYAARYGVDPGLFPTRIALGQESVDTRTNAEEVARWLAAPALPLDPPRHQRPAHAPRLLRDRAGASAATSPSSPTRWSPIRASRRFSANITNICWPGSPA